MPINADQLRDLLALGLSAKTVVEVVAIFDRDRNVTRDVTRDVTGGAERAAHLERARLRQQKYRDKTKTSETSPVANDAGEGDAKIADRDVTRDVTNNVTAGKRCDLSSLLTESQNGIREVSKKDTTSVEEGRKARVSRGTRLSETSQLSPDDRQFARSEGLTDERIDRAWAEFIDYWIGVPGQRGTKLNWSSTWRNRVRAISTKQGGPNGQRPTGGARQSAGSDFFAGLEKVAANISGYSPMAGDGAEAIPLGRFNLDG